MTEPTPTDVPAYGSPSTADATRAADAPRPAGAPARTGTACLEIHVLPWKRRTRMVDFGPIGGIPSVDDDVLGPVVATLFTVLGILFTVVVVGSVVLVLLELWVLLALAVLLLLARFVGLLPWVVDPATGGPRERYRWLPNAVGRVRALNGGGRVRVRWSWVG